MESSDLYEERNRWTLTKREFEAVANKNATNRLAFAALLIFFRNVGHFPHSFAEIKSEMIAFVREQLGVDGTIRIHDELDRTTKRHRAEIRTFFGFREATVTDGEELSCWVRDHAVSDTRDDDSLGELLREECRRRVEPPGRERFDRIIRSAVSAYEDRFCAQTVAKLTPVMRAKLDSHLQPADGEESDAALAVLTTLREGAGRAGVNSIRDEMAKLDIIKQLELPAHFPLCLYFVRPFARI